MYDVYLQYGHDSPEYKSLVQQKEEAESECRERLTSVQCSCSVYKIFTMYICSVAEVKLEEYRQGDNAYIEYCTLCHVVCTYCSCTEGF